MSRKLTSNLPPRRQPARSTSLPPKIYPALSSPALSSPAPSSPAPSSPVPSSLALSSLALSSLALSSLANFCRLLSQLRHSSQPRLYRQVIIQSLILGRSQRAWWPLRLRRERPP